MPIPTPSAMLRRAAAERFRRMHMQRRALIHPTDSPRATAPSAGDPVRILLVGNGLVHGWGVATHQLAPTGELARGFRTITGAGCAVEFWGDAAMTVEDAEQWLPATDHTPFDAAVIAVGSSDALRFTAASVWRHHLQQLIGSVRARLVHNAPVVVMGVPDVFVAEAVRRLPWPVRPHAALLDATTAAVVAAESGEIEFIPAPRLRSAAGTQPDESLYAAFTVPAATALAHLVDTTAPLASTRFGRKDDEFGDPVVQALVEASRWDELPELARLLDGVRLRTGALDAAITLVDDEHAWLISADRAVPSAVPRALTFSHTVVTTGQPLVVPDARLDPRFAGIPIAHLFGLRFYAGVPLRTDEGRIIGAIHLFDRRPIDIDAAELARLDGDAKVAWDMMRATAGRAVGARR